MCLACDTTLVTRSALTWAIPVNITTLGAHLDAYMSVKPDVHQLRLCHRFGKGPNAHLTKLPQELLDMVAQSLIDLAIRDAPHDKWQEPFSCFENRCYVLDHVDEEELDEMRNDICDELGYYHDDEVEEILLTRICEDGAYNEICFYRKHAWVNMVQQKHSSDLCPVSSARTYGFEEYDKANNSTSHVVL